MCFPNDSPPTVFARGSRTARRGPRALRSFDGAGASWLRSANFAQLAEAFVMIGDFDSAVRYLGRALADSVDAFYTPALFGLDPIWDPLRERADFKRLVAQR